MLKKQVERAIHLLLITPKRKPSQIQQVIDLQQPIEFNEALKYLDSLNIPGGVGRVRAVGVISGSPSSIYSEWEDEDDDDDDEEGRETRSRERHGAFRRFEMKRKGFSINTMPRDTIVFTARRNHIEDINTESRLLDEKSGYGLFLKNNDKEHGPGNPYVKREFWANRQDQEHWEEDEKTYKLDKNPKSKLPVIPSRIPMPSTRP